LLGTQQHAVAAANGYHHTSASKHIRQDDALSSCCHARCYHCSDSTQKIKVARCSSRGLKMNLKYITYYLRSPECIWNCHHDTASGQKSMLFTRFWFDQLCLTSLMLNNLCAAHLLLH
jgi:hypothetical protein